MATKTPRRAGFALRGGRFPMNTPGRRKIAPMMAKHALNRGTITRAQYNKVVRAAGRKPTKRGAGRNGHRRSHR